METQQVQEDCFRTETGAGVQVETERATEIVDAPEASIEILISKTRECLLDSQTRYFEAGDLVKRMLVYAAHNRRANLTLEKIARQIGRWKKSFLSKLGKVSEAFSPEDRVEAVKLGATWEDCYRSLGQASGTPIENLKKHLEGKLVRKKKLDKTEKALEAICNDSSRPRWQISAAGIGLHRYRKARRVHEMLGGGQDVNVRADIYLMIEELVCKNGNVEEILSQTYWWRTAAEHTRTNEAGELVNPYEDPLTIPKK
jgi:hypothetical protein